MTPPYPRGFGRARADQRGRLRIVDHRKLRIKIQLRRILAIAFDEGVIHLGRDTLIGPLEGVVKAFCRAVKKFRSCHHFPSDLGPQFLEKRNKTMKYLCHPPTEPRRIDMHHALPLDIAPEFSSHLYSSLACDVLILLNHP